jgi:hypothetical protein
MAESEMDLKSDYSDTPMKLSDRCRIAYPGFSLI